LLDPERQGENVKISLIAAVLVAAGIAFPAHTEETAATVALKDGGTLVVGKDGKTYHTDSKGKRVRMKDGVVMEGKDGSRYLMKNDALWKAITDKGTLAPNR
jgi:hypothetical protein